MHIGVCMAKGGMYGRCVQPRKGGRCRWKACIAKEGTYKGTHGKRGRMQGRMYSGQRRAQLTFERHVAGWREDYLRNHDGGTNKGAYMS